MTCFSSADSGLDAVYKAKRDAGLVDVKFLYKNLDEGTPVQVGIDLVMLQEAIKDGKIQSLDFGDLCLKNA